MDFSTHVFVINKIGTRVGGNPSVQGISLGFCSPEGMRDGRVRVSKSYTNTIDFMVEDILTAPQYINSKKALFIEPTKGVRKMVVPNTHPFQFINDLKKDAIS